MAYNHGCSPFPRPYGQFPRMAPMFYGQPSPVMMPFRPTMVPIGPMGQIGPMSPMVQPGPIAFPPAPYAYSMPPMQGMPYPGQGMGPVPRPYPQYQAQPQIGPIQMFPRDGGENEYQSNEPVEDMKTDTLSPPASTTKKKSHSAKKKPSSEVSVGISAESGTDGGVTQSSMEELPPRKRIDVSRCEVCGDGTAGGMPGEQMTIRVVLRDSDGNKLETVDDAVVEMVIDHKSEHARGIATYCGGGTYSITYSFPYSDMATIHIIIDGNELEMSPFCVVFYGTPLKQPIMIQHQAATKIEAKCPDPSASDKVEEYTCDIGTLNDPADFAPNEIVQQALLTINRINTRLSEKSKAKK